MKRYIYPQLPAAFITPFFRVGGSGLANGLFVYGKAIVSAHKYDAQIIAPQWFNISLGTYKRHQADKRHYKGIFNPKGEITGLKKNILLTFIRRVDSTDELINRGGILVEKGIYDFFKPLLSYHSIIREYIESHLYEGLLRMVEKENFSNCIAVHVRLGDFPENRKIPMAWYRDRIIEIGKNRRILLFSDGRDDELSTLLEMDNVERFYGGGALQDILAISRCQYLIGSDSSFSAWGAFLGQVPCHFYRFQFGQILENQSDQKVDEGNYYK